jgi:propanol-preferring alcohol dehydrogenase
MTNTWKLMPYPTPEGQVGGHEGVGKIVKMGPGAEASSGGLKVGDRVGIKWMAGICGACEACRAGADANCFDGVSRFWSLSAVGKGKGVDGDINNLH